MIDFVSHGLLLLGVALLAASVFGSSVVSVMLNSRLMSVLQSKHHALWQDLDAPDFWHVLLFGGKPFDAIPAPSAGGLLGSRYFTELALAGYKDIDDPAVAKIGERLRKTILRMGRRRSDSSISRYYSRSNHHFQLAPPAGVEPTTYRLGGGAERRQRLVA